MGIKTLSRIVHWVSKDVCTYLSIGLTALDGLIKRKQLTPIFKLTERNTRLFFVNDVKLLKIDYDAYLKFQKNNQGYHLHNK